MVSIYWIPVSIVIGSIWGGIIAAYVLKKHLDTANSEASRWRKEAESIRREYANLRQDYINLYRVPPDQRPFLPLTAVTQPATDANNIATATMTDRQS